MTFNIFTGSVLSPNTCTLYKHTSTNVKIASQEMTPAMHAFIKRFDSGRYPEITADLYKDYKEKYYPKPPVDWVKYAYNASQITTYQALPEF